MGHVAHVIDGPAHRACGMGGRNQLCPAPFNRISDGHGASPVAFAGRLGLAAGHLEEAGPSVTANPWTRTSGSTIDLRQDVASGSLFLIYPALARTAAMMRS